MTAITRESLFDLSEELLIRPGHPPFEELEPWQQVFCLVWQLEAEINNGGFEQFFFNSVGEWASKTPQGLLSIGAAKTADIVRRALAVFPDGAPPKDIEERRDAVEKLGDAELDLLDELDSAFLAYEDPLEDLLLAWVVRNRK